MAQNVANNIEYWSDEYAKEVNELESLVTEMETEAEENPDGSPLLMKLSAKVDDKCAVIKKAKKFYGLELRLVKDRAQRNHYDTNAKELDGRVNDITKKSKAIQEKMNKKELFATSQPGMNSKNPYDTEGKNNDELLTGANKIQDMTFESLARTRNMIEASKEVGTSTLEELARQREQITDIDKEVTNIDSKLVRAEKMVINFTRRMASDRLIQFCAAINIVVMIALCLYVGITGKKFTDSQSSNNSGPPPATASPSLRRL